VANNGVRFEFDLAFPFCYPGGPQAGRAAASTPIAGQAVHDIAEIGDGTAGVGTANGVAYAGGGFDFTNSAATAAGTDQGVIAPASVMADLFASYGGKSQQFLIAAYVKLPTLANWFNSAGIMSILGDKSYATDASIGALGFLSGGLLQWRRQLAVGSYDTTAPLQIAPASNDYGNVVQLAVWRNASGQGLRLRSANGTVLASRAVGADNAADFSANKLCFGRNAGSFPGSSGGCCSSTVRVPRLSWLRRKPRSIGP
jgi:hypothetical protein